ncbi:MAG: hypothetical protein JSW55_04995 [Chloroflexota bacterium]|nr:MAG: hypothetical protein JSW55_04995 [Chloroflexota bacterium]
MSKSQSILLVIIGCLLLLVTNISIWATFNLFNSERFGELVAQGMQSEQASLVLAEEVTDFIFEDLADVPDAVRAAVVDIVAWIIQGPIFEPIIATFAGVAHAVMTTDLSDVLGFDLAEVMPYVIAVATVIDPELAEELSAVQQSEPFQLITTNELPGLTQAARIVPWLWPLAALGAIASLGIALRWAEDRPEAFKFIGIGVAASGAICLAFVPAARLSMENAIADPGARIVISEIVKALTRGLVIQSLILASLGVVAIVVGPRMEA